MRFLVFDFGRACLWVLCVDEERAAAQVGSCECNAGYSGPDGGACTACPPGHTLHPAPYTLYPTPYTLHPTPYTLHP
eukprot:1898560-Rhodomonas_salina.1